VENFQKPSHNIKNMSIKINQKNSTENSTAIDFEKLYDIHAEYSARRIKGSLEQEKIAIEVTKFKIPNLVSLLPSNYSPQRVIEIGCATGELIAEFPIEPGGHRIGVDISSSNILSARERFPEVEFYAGNFTDLALAEFDCVILSDILEHVENDVGFLAEASCLGRYVLVNLPLEDNWFNWNRNYGVNDDSGHLRKYSLEQGLDLLKHAGLDVIKYNRLWVHETVVAGDLRKLNYKHFGIFYNGGPATRLLKRMVIKLIDAFPFLGRRLFASNLFVIAQRDPRHEIT
jgi:SAM-dependent methyltransferase